MGILCPLPLLDLGQKERRKKKSIKSHKTTLSPVQVYRSGGPLVIYCLYNVQQIVQFLLHFCPHYSRVFQQLEELFPVMFFWSLGKEPHVLVLHSFLESISLDLIDAPAVKRNLQPSFCSCRKPLISQCLMIRRWLFTRFQGEFFVLCVQNSETSAAAINTWLTAC